MYEIVHGVHWAIKWSQVLVVCSQKYVESYEYMKEIPYWHVRTNPS